MLGMSSSPATQPFGCRNRIRAMRYNSDKAGDAYRDMKSLEGPLYAIFSRTPTPFIVRNTPSIARFIKGQPKREDSPLYPEDAVREALINALAHRDCTPHRAVSASTSSRGTLTSGTPAVSRMESPPKASRRATFPSSAILTFPMFCIFAASWKKPVVAAFS